MGRLVVGSPINNSQIPRTCMDTLIHLSMRNFFKRLEPSTTGTRSQEVASISRSESFYQSMILRYGKGLFACDHVPATLDEA